MAAGGGQDSLIWIWAYVAIALIFTKEDGFLLAGGDDTTVAQTSIEVEWLRKGLVVDWNEEAL